MVAETVAVSGVGAGVGPGYGGMQPGRVYFKMRKVYFASSNKTYICWSSMWTRMDLKLKDRIEFDNSVKVLGLADKAGSYAMEDEFGNTFRSFFIACDVQDLLAAGYYSQKVRIDHIIFFLSLEFLLIVSIFRSETISRKQKNQ
jgi:hypothetical protein